MAVVAAVQLGGEGEEKSEELGPLGWVLQVQTVERRQGCWVVEEIHAWLEWKVGRRNQRLCCAAC